MQAYGRNTAMVGMDSYRVLGRRYPQIQAATQATFSGLLFGRQIAVKAFYLTFDTIHTHKRERLADRG